MLRASVSSDSARFIKSREPKHQRQILNKILSLCQDPHPPDLRTVRGTEMGERRAKAGEYRIIYRVELPSDKSAGVLHVDAVGKRNDDEVYRRFDRR